MDRCIGGHITKTDMQVCGWTERCVGHRGIWLDTCEREGGQKDVWDTGGYG